LLLDFSTPKISQKEITFPDRGMVDKIFMFSDRNNRVLGNLSRLYETGNLARTGYLSILPVDQGIEQCSSLLF